MRTGSLSKGLAVVIAAVVMSGVPTVRCRAAEDIKVKISCQVTEEGLFAEIEDMKPHKKYEISVNGGKTFSPVNSTAGTLFDSLGRADVQVCARVTGEPRTVSDITVACTAEEQDEEICTDVWGLRENTYKGGGIRVRVRDSKEGERYTLIVNGGEIRAAMEKGECVIDGLASGYYRVQVQRNGNDPAFSRSKSVYVPYKVCEGGAVIRRIPAVRQNPELPTGCEVTSLAMALSNLGIKVDKEVLADHYLPKSPYRTGDYRRTFVGDPHSTYAYGCYAGVIEECAESFLSVQRGRSFDVVNITGCEPDRLYACLDMGYPVIVWATMNMTEVTEGASWKDEATGRTVVWKGNEHCLLLTGYDISRKTVYLNDPLKGAVGCDMGIFEQRFADMEKQAVFIVETTEKDR